MQNFLTVSVEGPKAKKERRSARFPRAGQVQVKSSSRGGRLQCAPSSWRPKDDFSAAEKHQQKKNCDNKMKMRPVPGPAGK